MMWKEDKKLLNDKKNVSNKHEVRNQVCGKEQSVETMGTEVEKRGVSVRGEK